MSFSRLVQYAEEELKSLVFDTSEPASDAISSILWNECQDVANEALNSDFMQGIGNGTLDPNKYGQYIVQDCAYCADAAEDYKQVAELAKAANEPLLAKFAEAHYKSYESYLKTYLPSWHVGNADALVLNEAGKAYIAHERAAVTTLHPIYGLIGQIPCERLWPWLAGQLKPKSPAHNVYDFWISENYNYVHRYLLSHYIDAWFTTNPNEYDHDTALAVFRGSMIGELNMFLAAFGQSLVPMPKLPAK